MQDLRFAASAASTLSLFSLTSAEVQALLTGVASSSAAWMVDEACDYHGELMLIFTLRAGGDAAPSLVVHRAAEGVMISWQTETAFRCLDVVLEISAAVPLLRSHLESCAEPVA
ncbi:hypothetical protein [Teichococcus vastitatis]|jgi:hypothetical protein|uniref:Uncharacterized protein n=1 Tax=Teichococcus vastitatis TaxID=2307076 RepID=A0ABS9VZZ7_9PROT|nr:hypothetical protein [Pseudoroseomonas vastitatis]MCI0752599.1 hypothetical protein [Pseudoroseomonas vastitatis]